MFASRSVAVTRRLVFPGAKAPGNSREKLDAPLWFRLCRLRDGEWGKGVGGTSPLRYLGHQSHWGRGLRARDAHTYSLFPTLYSLLPIPYSLFPFSSFPGVSHDTPSR